MKKKTPQYDDQSKERARCARYLADLLWMKACKTLSPDQKNLLLQKMRLEEIAATVAPEDVEQVSYTFESIAQAVEKAEQLLIAVPTALRWEDFPALVKEEG